MSLNFTTDTSTQLTYSSFGFTTPQLDNFATSNQLLITSNQIINKINTDITGINTNLTTNYYNKTATDGLLNAKEQNLTFSSPLTRSTNTIGINLSSYYNSTTIDTLLSNKQSNLTSATNLLGVGSAITALDYNKITLNKPTNFQSDWNSTVINKPTNFQADWTSTVINKPTNFQSDWLTTIINKPSTFPTDMTNIYTKTETNTLITNTSNYALNISNVITININNTCLKLAGGTMTGAIVNTSTTASDFKGIYIMHTARQTHLPYLPDGKFYFRAPVIIDNPADFLSFGSRTGDFIIKMFGEDYGFGVNGYTLRYNAAAAASHKFYTGSTNTFTINEVGNISTLGTITEAGTLLSSKYLQLAGGTMTANANITLSGTGTFTGIHSGNGAALTNLPLSAYSTTGNDSSYLLKTGGTLTGNLIVNADLRATNMQVGGATYQLLITPHTATKDYAEIQTIQQGVGYNQKLVLQPINGNVGIGIINPSAKFHIYEATGTVAGADAGSIIIDHDNSGGASSITFRSKVNRGGGDYGYIQYQDAATVNGGGEGAKLIIGVQNDGDDDILLLPSGGVGINTASPSGYKLYVHGNTYFNGNSTVNANILNIGGSVPYLQLKSDNYNLAVSGGIGNFSSSSVANDMILRTIAGTNLYLQAGVAGHALKIDSANNVSIPNKLTISGEMNNAVNTWHKSSEGISRTYYDSNGTTYFQSGKISGTGNAFSFQNRESTASIFSIDAAAGAIYIGSNLSNSFQLYVSAPYLTLPAYIQTLKLSSPYTFNQYLAIQPLGGNAGIGTDTGYSTGTKLTIKGSSTAASQPIVRMEQTAAWDGAVNNYVLETVGYTNLNGIRINGGDTNSIYKTAATGDMGFTVQNGNMIFNTNSVERMRIDNAGYINIGTTGQFYKLYVNGTTYFNGNSVTNGTTTMNNDLLLNGANITINKVSPVFIVSSTEENQHATILLGTPFQNVGAYKCAIIAEAQSAWSKSKLHFCLNNVDDNTRGTQNASLANSRVNIDYNGNMNISGRTYCNGGLNIQVNSWVYDTNGSQRIFFGGGGRSYYQGYGQYTTDIQHEWRNHVGTGVMFLSYTGSLLLSGEIIPTMTSIANSGTDYCGVSFNSSQGTSYQSSIKIMYGTFTGFHRCFTDDIEYNQEEPQKFKDDYVGRIVVSTGKIATDTKSNDDTEWTIKYDKEGITIEDAVFMIQLSRKKKDKRVVGVLGMASRANSRPERMIVNSVGEGGILVCNSNGCFENGDFITSSDYIGYGQLQDDDLFHNYTVGKITIDCDFQLDSPYYNCYEIDDLDANGNKLRVAFVSCIYHCG